MLLMKEISVERDSRVDTGNISNICTELYAHKWGKKLPGLTFQQRGSGGRRENQGVEGKRWREEKFSLHLCEHLLSLLQ